MRDILFRAFTPDENGKDRAFVNGEWIKGQWVQGSYWELNKTTYCCKEDYERDPGNTEHYIIFDQMTDWGLPNRHLKAVVLPETLGQYIGLTDTNGKRIFEGDIVKGTFFGFPMPIENYVFTIGWQEDVAGYKANYFENVEIIGNIHDTPELIKGGV